MTASCYDESAKLPDRGDFVKKAITGILICMVLMILAVLLLPFPHHYDVALTGYNAAAGQDGLQITVKGWEYRYLLKDDQIRANITVIDPDGTVTDWTTVGQVDPYPDETMDFDYGTVYRYNAQKNSIEFAQFAFTQNLEALLLQKDDSLRIVAAPVEDPDTDDLLNLFSPFTK